MRMLPARTVGVCGSEEMQHYDDIRRVAGAFEREVPEYRAGAVVLIAVASEPGVHSKVAVDSPDRDVDPVGACVGADGARIRAVVEALGGERIDIVPFEEDPVLFVCNALAPAWIKRVLVDDENRTMELIVEDAELEKALGEQGRNLRLASVLTGWGLDLMSESRVDAMRQELREALGGLETALVDELFARGYTKLAYLAAETPEALADFAELTLERATAVIAAARGGT